MGLTKPALEAVKRECRLICFGYLGGSGLVRLIKFEEFRKFLLDFMGDTYSEAVAIEDFDLWFKEYMNAKSR